MRWTTLQLVMVVSATALVSYDMLTREHSWAPPRKWTAPRLKPVEPRVPMEEGLSTMLKDLGVRGTRLVDLGAAVRDNDPCFALIDRGWSAILVDGDARSTGKWHHRFPGKMMADGGNVVGIISYILADTIAGVLAKHGFDGGLDLLKIDIDSFDCHVMSAILMAGIRPTVIVMEANVKYPPHVRVAQKPGFRTDKAGIVEQIPYDSEKRGLLYGCSVGYQVHDVMVPHGYEIYYQDWNNVMYVDSRQIDLEAPALSPQESVEAWYNFGYWQRPNRDQAFSFNQNTVKFNAMKAAEVMQTLQTKPPQRFDETHRGHHVSWNGVDYCFDAKIKLVIASPEACPGV